MFLMSDKQCKHFHMTPGSGIWLPVILHDYKPIHYDRRSNVPLFDSKKDNKPGNNSEHQQVKIQQLRTMCHWPR